MPDTISSSAPLLSSTAAISGSLAHFCYMAASNAKNARTVRPVTPRGARLPAAEFPGVVPAVVEPPEVLVEFAVVSMVKKVAPIAGPSPSCVRHRES